MKFKIIEFPELSSTNTYAKENIKSLGTGDIIYTEKQTAGKGRHGKTWEAPKGKNLTFSIVIKDLPSDSNTFAYIQTASLAIHEILKQCGLSQQWIKWPNDVYVGDKKIAGILCESIPNKESLSLIIGIGININSTIEDFSPFPIKPTSLLIETKDDEPYLLKEVLTCTLNNFNKFSKLQEQGLVEALHQLWIERTELIHKTVTLIQNDKKIEGQVHSFKDDGSLLLLHDNELKSFNSAKLSLRIKNLKDNTFSTT